MPFQSLYFESGPNVLPPLTAVECKYAPQTDLHLYHFPLSLCSQHVRQALEEKQVKWQSHVVLLPAYENFNPNYVRINPRCVVPSLVHDGKVTTDATNILGYIDRTFADRPLLVPQQADEASCMKDFLNQADALFIEALTFGVIPGIKQPISAKFMAKSEVTTKVKILTDLLNEFRDEEFLKDAYERKLALVRSTNESVRSPETMVEVLRSTDEEITLLEHQLSQGPFAQGGWLCSKSFSLADIGWGVALNRFMDVGLADQLWGTKPNVKKYISKIITRPSFIRAVTEWNNPIKDVVIPLIFNKVKVMFKKWGDHKEKVS